MDLILQKFLSVQLIWNLLLKLIPVDELHEIIDLEELSKDRFLVLDQVDFHAGLPRIVPDHPSEDCEIAFYVLDFV